MKRISKRISARLKIVAATATVIFTLLTVFTSTIAWFSTKASATVSGGSFTVKPVSGIQYDIYYLDHFVVNDSNVDGNYNTIFHTHSGYEQANANPVFNPISFDDNGNVIDANQNIVSEQLNPTNISHLWPAHRLTFAIVIDSSNFTSFSLDSWDEVTDANIKTKDSNDHDVLISLSWAINLYGAAYRVDKVTQNSTENIQAELSAGYASYRSAFTNGSLHDSFTYKPVYVQPDVEPELPLSVTNTVTDVSSSNDSRIVLFFTIEFDDSVSTWYEYDENNNYYTQSTTGNSNCYEHLSLKDLVFKLA